MITKKIFCHAKWTCHFIGSTCCQSIHSQSEFQVFIVNIHWYFLLLILMHSNRIWLIIFSMVGIEWSKKISNRKHTIECQSSKNQLEPIVKKIRVYRQNTIKSLHKNTQLFVIPFTFWSRSYNFHSKMYAKVWCFLLIILKIVVFHYLLFYTHLLN